MVDVKILSLTNAAPRTSAERNIAVVMAVLGILGQEVVRVEHFWVFEVSRISVYLVHADDDC